MVSLRDLQRSFAAALRDPSIACPVLPPSNLSIYRNNARLVFRGALESSFPVVRRRVGDDYFAQLAHHYRERFPSRSGDLQFIGENFAAFLAEHLRGGDYAWLADLALVEWSREQALISAELPAIGTEALARFAPEELEQLVFALQPSLRLHASAYPVFSVWLANQSDSASPVAQSLGSEAGLVRIHHEKLEIRLLEPRLFSYICALCDGVTLGDAVERAGLDEAALMNALAFIFNEELVTAVALREGGNSNGQETGTSS